jgi:S-adenosylmethionine:tRNA ribosyltransferase-isomerase
MSGAGTRPSQPNEAAEASLAGAARLSLADLEYELPEELIAQAPAEPRDASRLLVLRRASGALEDRVFAELPRLLRAGDVLVRNDTRVFPARTHFRRASGGRLEVLFLRPSERGGGEARGGAHAAAGGDGSLGELWEALVRGRPRPGEEIVCEGAPEWTLRCEASFGDGRWLVRNLAERPVFALLETAGETPLPPYVRAPLADAERYQTSYARVLGSAAAPTAGLHFTPRLDQELLGAGVTIETITLHVGLGTFKPLQAETLAGGRLHSEVYDVEPGVWARLGEARAQGRRVIAVGTTSVRTLEHLAGGGALSGETSLFINPGHRFGAVDGMLTNFHLPRTSLLALVMAFAGVEATRRAYAHAVAARYRFYSLGDAMLAL